MQEIDSVLRRYVKNVRSTIAASVLFMTLLLVPAVCEPASAAEDAVKPVIGINTDVVGGKPGSYRILPDYVSAVKKAGGIPVLIPPMADEDLSTLIGQIDGVMMIGGNDYPPSLYEQAPHQSVVPMEDERANFDIAIVREVLKNGRIPFLGICAGCQALNIGAGGSLVQDIPTRYADSKVSHSGPRGWQVGFNKHVVKPEPGSALASFIGNTGLNVVTSHHQSVDRVGEGFRVAARTEDGVIESIESKDRDFIVGVQWHPERDFETNQKLFNEFIKRGRIHKQARTQGNASSGQLPL